MISSVNGIAFRIIKSNKFIFITSILSIILSVALIINLYTFLSNAESNFKDGISELIGDMDLIVGYDIGSTKQIDDQLSDRIISLENIKEASKVMTGHLELNVKQNINVYSVGIDNTSLSKGRYRINKDILDNELVLNENLAKSYGISVGDYVKINNESLKIVGLLDGVKKDAAVYDILIVNINTFKNLTTNGEKSTYFLLSVIDKSQIYNLVNQLKSIDNDFKIDVMEEQDFVTENLAQLKVFLTILSILTIVMSSLFILSNFQIFLYNYRKQFALIRAIGGLAQQAFRIVFIQATIINMVGVLIAYLISYISCRYLTGIFNVLFSLEVSSIKFPFLVAALIALISLLVIEIFMLKPASNGSKILPLKILQENEKISREVKRRKNKGIFIIFLSFIMFAFGIMNTTSCAMLLGLISSMLLIIGTYKLFNYYLKDILNFCLPFFKFLSGDASFVAVRNLIPQIKNNSLIILSISTTIIISVFGGNLFRTVEANGETYLKEQYAMDIVVNDRNNYNSTLGNSIKEDLDKLSDVRNASIFSNGTSMYYEAKTGTEYLGYYLANIEPLIEEGLIPDYYGEIKSDIVITKKIAEKNNLKVGDSIKVKKEMESLPPLDQVDMNSQYEILMVGAVIDKLPVSYPKVDAIFDWSNSEYVNERTHFYRAIIASNNIKNTIEDLSVLKRQYPEIKWGTLSEALEQSRQMGLQRWAFFIVATILILISLFFGLFNTLINNIVSKRKEYAILRTLNLDKKGLVKVILTQVMTYQFIGVSLGLVLGMLITVIVTSMDSKQIQFSIEYKLVSIIISLLLLLSMFIFVPYGIKLANRKISQEITVDIR